ncbi:hypothetical protein OIE69_43890 (plasmid) [Actinacidiphila glaucinigra]|uniref:hypothetical protein n=1 Tax=Actinacidiphila glaucinigra TaxID=235986 RepID=UPI002DDA78B2|nr:hypothetical protein [Actinacidiphila glaucinigra]WSD65847.1 hypothetical protein OIE69_43890 [Actinacidiphila glaucinigra]
MARDDDTFEGEDDDAGRGNVVRLPVGQGAYVVPPRVPTFEEVRPPAIPDPLREEPVPEIAVPPVPTPMAPAAALAAEAPTDETGDDGPSEEYDVDAEVPRSLADRIGDWIDFRISRGRERHEAEMPLREAEVARKVDLLKARTNHDVTMSGLNSKLQQERLRGRGPAAGSGGDKGRKRTPGPNSGTPKNSGGASGRSPSSNGKSPGKKAPEGPSKGHKRGTEGNGPSKGRKDPQKAAGGAASPDKSKTGKIDPKGSGDAKKSPKKDGAGPKAGDPGPKKNGTGPKDSPKKDGADPKAGDPDPKKSGTGPKDSPKKDGAGPKAGDPDPKKSGTGPKDSPKKDGAGPKAGDPDPKKSGTGPKDSPKKDGAGPKAGDPDPNPDGPAKDKGGSGPSTPTPGSGSGPGDDPRSAEGQRGSGRGPGADDAGSPREGMWDRFRKNKDAETEAPGPVAAEDLGITVERADEPHSPPQGARQDPTPKELGPGTTSAEPQSHTASPTAGGATQSRERTVQQPAEAPGTSGAAGLAPQHRTNITFAQFLQEMASMAVEAAGDQEYAQNLSKAMGIVADELRAMAGDLAQDHNVAPAVVNLLVDLADSAATLKFQAQLFAHRLATAATAAVMAAREVSRVYGEDMQAKRDAGLAHASAAAHHN